MELSFGWRRPAEKEKKMKTKSIFVVAILISCVSGCATAPRVVSKPSDLPSIQSEKAGLLEKTKVGMPLSEFRQLVPEAYVVGQKDETTAYELAYEQKYVTNGDVARHRIPFSNKLNARTYKQVLWFYFYQDRLVQWGQPNVWPTKPDMILEKEKKEKASEPNAPITISPKVIQ